MICDSNATATTSGGDEPEEGGGAEAEGASAGGEPTDIPFVDFDKLVADSDDCVTSASGIAEPCDLSNFGEEENDADKEPKD